MEAVANRNILKMSLINCRRMVGFVVFAKQACEYSKKIKMIFKIARLHQIVSATKSVAVWRIGGYWS